VARDIHSRPVQADAGSAVAAIQIKRLGFASYGRTFECRRAMAWLTNLSSLRQNRSWRSAASISRRGRVSSVSCIRWRKQMQPISRSFVFAAILSFAGLAGGQVNPGTPSFSAYDSHQYDVLNLQNLNVALNVPVMSKSGAFPFHASLAQNYYIF
jgi:hypothetical protein